MRFLAIALAFAGLLAFDTATASAAPPIPHDRKLDLELKQADIHNVLRLLADVGGRDLVPDACVKGRVDLKLQNTPVSLVLDALALKLQLTYTDDGSVIHVGCAGTDSGTTPDAPRVTVSVKQAELPAILDDVARMSKLDGVDYKATAKPRLDLTMQNVRLPTALAALADESNLAISVSKNRLVVTDR